MSKNSNIPAESDTRKTGAREIVQSFRCKLNQRNDGQWEGRYAEFPGIWYVGASPEEARHKLEIALELVVEHLGDQLRYENPSAVRDKQLNIRFTAYEMRMIRAAADIEGEAGASSFIHDMAVRKACEVIANGPTNQHHDAR